MNKAIELITTSFTKEVVSFIRETDPDFSCFVKMDWDLKRTSSRGGLYKAGPGINLAMKHFNTMQILGRYWEYVSFKKVPEIGEFYYDVKNTPYLGPKALICHEVGHAYMAFKDASCTAHGDDWKAIYRALRNKFVNPLIDEELNGFKIKNTTSDLDSVTIKDDNKTLFDLHCHKHGLDKSHYGRDFFYKKDTYTIIGINPRAPKYPIMGRRHSDSSNYRFPPNVVLKNLL